MTTTSLSPWYIGVAIIVLTIAAAKDCINSDGFWSFFAGLAVIANLYLLARFIVEQVE